ncbi:MAG TPA: DUF2382 domain-containing protein [Anaeromyxobacter sp.]
MLGHGGNVDTVRGRRNASSHVVATEEGRGEATARTGERMSSSEGEHQEETLRVPVREEDVEVTKRPRVREEVRVSKTARQEERRAEGDVRREEARVERTGDEESPARGHVPGRDDES